MGHTHNSVHSTISASHYKDRVFPDVECLDATIKYKTQCISYTTIKPDNIIHMKCALVFCDECPKYIITDEELDYGTNDLLINLSVYTYQVICEKHGIIPNGQSL